MKPGLIEQLMGECRTAEEIFGETGMLKQLTKALVERALQAELTTHQGYEKHAAEGRNSGNSRNGSSRKQLKGESGGWRSPYRGTATTASSRSWCRRGRTGCRALMRRSCRCMCGG